MQSQEYFISGIDTDCGKTHITSLLGYYLKVSGKKIITTKLVQTGCKGIAEDLIEHRKVMEDAILPVDKAGLTCGYVYSFPASPHLAAKIDNIPFDVNHVRNSIEKLKNSYDIILTEGAGGLMVPLTDSYYTIDYIVDNKIPLILVGSSKLGSINHSLLSLEICRQRKVNLHTFVYNKIPGHDITIAEDSFEFISRYIKNKLPDTKVIHSNDLENLKAVPYFKSC
jgi:dethiobiotin synthetase